MRPIILRYGQKMSKLSSCNYLILTSTNNVLSYYPENNFRIDYCEIHPIDQLECSKNVHTAFIWGKFSLEGEERRECCLHLMYENKRLNYILNILKTGCIVLSSNFH